MLQDVWNLQRGKYERSVLGLVNDFFKPPHVESEVQSPIARDTTQKVNTALSQLQYMHNIGIFRLSEKKQKELVELEFKCVKTPHCMTSKLYDGISWKPVFESKYANIEIMGTIQGNALKDTHWEDSIIHVQMLLKKYPPVEPPVIRILTPLIPLPSQINGVKTYDKTLGIVNSDLFTNEVTISSFFNTLIHKIFVKKPKIAIGVQEAPRQAMFPCFSSDSFEMIEMNEETEWCPARIFRFDPSKKNNTKLNTLRNFFSYETNTSPYVFHHYMWFPEHKCSIGLHKNPGTPPILSTPDVYKSHICYNNDGSLKPACRDCTCDNLQQCQGYQSTRQQLGAERLAILNVMKKGKLVSLQPSQSSPRNNPKKELQIQLKPNFAFKYSASFWGNDYSFFKKLGFKDENSINCHVFAQVWQKNPENLHKFLAPIAEAQTSPIAEAQTSPIAEPQTSFTERSLNPMASRPSEVFEMDEPLNVNLSLDDFEKALDEIP